MSQNLTVELSDEAFSALRRQAEEMGSSASAVAASTLEQRFRSPVQADPAPKMSTGQLRRRFGSVDLGRPTGSDNETIDADLAREYGETHETR